VTRDEWQGLGLELRDPLTRPRPAGPPSVAAATEGWSSESEPEVSKAGTRGWGLGAVDGERQQVLG
jgi:hypothetical protein